MSLIQPVRDVIQPLGCGLEPGLHSTGQLPFGFRKSAFQRGQVGRYEFRCRRRRGRPEVGDKVGNAEIRFVSHGGYDGDGGRKHR